MSKEKEEVTKEPSKFDKLKEMWKDKRGRAKIKLSLYLIFFVGVVIFARVLSYQNSKLPHNDNVNNNSFIYTLKDNYEYDINIEKDNNKYNYHGRKLGLNESIKVKDDNKEEYYYVMNNKYYSLDNKGNYILSTSEEVYPYINYKFMNINFIKELIKDSTKDGNVYKVKLSTLVLNNTSDNYVTIEVNEDTKTITIDYTELFKIDDSSINKVLVTMTYSNINQILSLEE